MSVPEKRRNHHAPIQQPIDISVPQYNVCPHFQSSVSATLPQFGPTCRDIVSTKLAFRLCKTTNTVMKHSLMQSTWPYDSRAFIDTRSNTVKGIRNALQTAVRFFAETLNVSCYTMQRVHGVHTRMYVVSVYITRLSASLGLWRSTADQQKLTPEKLIAVQLANA